MTDSVQEHEGPNGPAQVLARIAQVLEENPENGLDAVREAFEAERERAQQEIREKAQDFDSLKEVRLELLRREGHHEALPTVRCATFRTSTRARWVSCWARLVQH